MKKASYEDVLGILIAVTQRWDRFEVCQRLVAVRDIRGRVRLVVDSDADLPTLCELEESLAKALGAWFAGPILCTHSGRPEERGITKALLGIARSWPPEWPADCLDPATGVAVARDARWLAINRTLARQEWLGSASAPPWELRSDAPKIVSFYSFKGGAGRSTALAITAWQLAKAGKRVVCVDLDLEAPGLDSIFAIDVDRGTIDFLLERTATGAASLDGMVTEAEVRGIRLDVVPAGWVSPVYIDKLGRLDFLSQEGPEARSPVHVGLRDLLKKLRALKPDYIFLDARSGLADLGGLAIHALSHVDVLVARANQQGRMGIEVAANTLSRKRRLTDQRVIVVHNFAALPLDGAASQLEQVAFRTSVWEIFRQTLYAGMEDSPGVDDSLAFHHPIVVGNYDEVGASESLTRMSESVLANDAFSALRVRIEELCVPDGDES